MDQLLNHKHKNDFLLSNNTSNRNRKIKILCNECNQKTERLDENNQVCHVCYKAKSVYTPSGNKVIDDFIKHTLVTGSRLVGKMVFVPYDQFKDVKFIAEGGFSKIYKATWIDGPIHGWSKKKQSFMNKKNHPVVLKKLNNSKVITSKELNELKIFHEFSLNSKYIGFVSVYFGITQDPVTKDLMIIMAYYNSGRRPFWDRIHDVELIIEIWDGLRPPIVTNAPEGYIELMKECWNSDPKKRPTAEDIYRKIKGIWFSENPNTTKIIVSPDIGPIAENNPGAVYKSRPLSDMILSAMFTRSLRSQSITAEVDLFRVIKEAIKFEDNQIESRFDEDKIIKKIKLIENKNNG
ncbi:kinase-like domain-containing protein [Rhizophagus irregularis DAOM 181602=DAOM 197198]|nr:kinase-like domain-containing protein [Rhizophagus irregularis DAOM 181602=DAOM 197198]